MCVSVCVCSDLWIVVGVWVHVCAGACVFSCVWFLCVSERLCARAWGCAC